MKIRPFIFLMVVLGIVFFTKTQASSITVIYPNGGESLEAGRTYKLQWNGQMTSLKLDNGYTIISHDDYNADPSGSYLWTIPLTTPPGAYRLQAMGCCGINSGSDVSDGQFLIVAPQNLYSFFKVSPSAISQNQPITLSWEIKGGVQASLKINCPAGSIGFLNSQRQKIYHCGDVINDLPLSANFDLRPQDYNLLTDVRFVLSALEVGGREGIYGNESLAVSFQPAQLISGYANSGLYLPPVDKKNYIFKKDLEYGMENEQDVKELQLILQSLGLFQGEATGNFYGKTFKAVKAFQKKYGIKQMGYVGPKTRAQLNRI